MTPQSLNLVPLKKQKYYMYAQFGVSKHVKQKMVMSERSKLCFLFWLSYLIYIDPVTILWCKVGFHSL